MDQRQPPVRSIGAPNFSLMISWQRGEWNHLLPQQEGRLLALARAAILTRIGRGERRRLAHRVVRGGDQGILESFIDSLLLIRLKTGVYHAGIDDHEKEAIHINWREGKVKSVVLIVTFLC